MANGFAQQLLAESRAARELGKDFGQIFRKGSTDREDVERSQRGRVLDENELLSVIAGAVQASRFTDQASQDQFLQRRIQTGQQQGRNMDNSIGLLNTPFPQRAPILKGILDSAREAGVLPQLPAQQRPRPLQRFGGLDPQGDPTTFAFDPGTGGARDIGIRPIPRLGEFETIRTEPGGGVTIQRGRGKPPEIGKKLERDVEGSLFASTKRLDDLAAIGQEIDDEFLTFRGAATSFVAGIADKAGVELSPDVKQFIGARKRFRNKLGQVFNAYRREITGAAASVQELEALKDTFLNADLGPTEFRAAFEDLVSETLRLQRLQRKVLREGVRGGFKSENSRAAQRVDALFTSGQDDDPDEFLEELEAKGVTGIEAGRLLLKGGYGSR